MKSSNVGCIIHTGMSMPLLSTKLRAPIKRAQQVHRPRLVDLLDRGCRGKLTLLSASAGYGKTTLFCQWLAGCGLPYAWLSLDEADNDPVHFLAYLIAALQQIELGLGEGILEAVQATEVAPAGSASPVELAVTLLLNEVASLDEPFVLALDDYHLIESHLVHELLTRILDHQPASLHLLISTRVDPPLPVARLRAQAQLLELRAADLCFTLYEANAFLNDVIGLILPTNQIDALEKHTEGWVAALQLAGLSMQTHTDKYGFIDAFTGSHHYIVDYLVEEVISQQTESVQEFLLYTSILEHMTGALCDSLTGRSDGQTMLERLAQRNLFVISLYVYLSMKAHRWRHCCAALGLKE